MDKQAISMVDTLQPTRLTRLILAHLIALIMLIKKSHFQ
jgi:hypothetical protein